MKGKEIKVIEYNLTFGQAARTVYILGLFKYKPNGNIYLVYCDKNSNYNLAYYGYSHVKNDAILSMQCRNKEDEEIIKKYIYTITNKEKEDDYEYISLDKVEGIEIISSSNLELKKEVIDELIELTIPKKIEEETDNTKKKGKSKKGLLIIPLLLLIAAAGYYIYTNVINAEETLKQIICTKEYRHKELSANIEEEQTFNFDKKDNLHKVDITKIYYFNNESQYYDFINSGTYYKYMPEEEGGWDKNDEDYTFTTTEIIRIETGYNKPTDYEEVLSYYKNDNFTCEEKVMN